MKYKPALFIVSGDLESGKTRFIQNMAQAMQAHGWDVAGIVSPAVFRDDAKVAIDALDLRSGKRCRLAELVQAGSRLQGPVTKRWQFSEETLNWCNSTLRSATPCDLLVIDELGPLEFEGGAGMVDAIEAIEGGDYLAALVVVRSILLEHAGRRWPHLERIDPTQADDHETFATDWAKKLAQLKT